MTEQLKQILTELREQLSALYGDRLDQLILFGSQARGDAEPDSDIDVMVVLKGEVNSYKESERVTEITAEISLKYAVLITCIYISADRYSRNDRALFRNVHREGIAL
jgi:uncharacterized protein